MKKLNLFVITLVAMMIPTVLVHAAETDCNGNYVAKIGDKCYATLNDAVNEVTTEETTIDVVKDINLEDAVDITGDKKVVLNLVNGVTISRADYILNLADTASLRITGKGEIKNIVEKYTEYTTTTNTIYVQNSAKLTIDKDVTLGGYDVVTMLSCTEEAQVDLYGTIVTRKDPTLNEDNLPKLGSGIYVNNGSGAPTIHIHEGAVITGEGMGLYLSGKNKTIIDKATIEGATGIAIKSGELTLNGTTVKGTYEYLDATPMVGGIRTTGAAIQIESNSDYDGHVKIHVNDGTYTSEHSYAFQEYIGKGDATNVEEIEVSAGTFESNAEDGNGLNLSEKFVEMFATKPFIASGVVFTNNGEAAKDVLDYTDNLNISESGVVGLVHNINTTTSKNGTVKAPKDAAEGETITIEYTPNKGFVIDTIVVKKADGSEITVTNGKFVMPDDEVTITVTFKEKNADVPPTGDNILTYVVIGTIALISALGIAIYFKKVND